MGELHGGEADATSRTEHDHPLVGLDVGNAPQRVVGGLMGDAERRGGAELHLVGHRPERVGRDGDALGEAADHRCPHHAVAGGELLDPVSELDDRPRQLAPGGERELGTPLVPVGDHEDVGEVDRCGLHLHHDLAGRGTGSATSSIVTVSGGP